ncbi:biotin-dependent carboxyltransferase family protein [Actinomadura flavalba]|uniref:5-oxoprolinase subunit C family protein n=1 Tax=Actinomadura flavalba TaxID=1120938 RepID=UPI00035D31F7|nr:biotin-dependent carboxyltransferase family protein [Actinomadura flavalba]
MIEVLRPGPLTTVQDLGRPGYAHLGVPGSGAADAGALRLAHRLVGNPEDAAALELTFGGLAVRALRGVWAVVTGAPSPVLRDGRPQGMNAPFFVPAGATVEVGTPEAGLRGYLAVRGGLVPGAVLGSRSTDLLSGLGPARVAAGDRLPVGPSAGLAPLRVDVAPVAPPAAAPVLPIVPGPRDDWFTGAALNRLVTEPYTVSADANRVGVRLEGPPLARSRDGELPSEGMVTGALQVPPDGRPILFLTDHPTTGGYPMIAVVAASALDAAAQLRPGQHVRFVNRPGAGGAGRSRRPAPPSGGHRRG